MNILGSLLLSSLFSTGLVTSPVDPTSTGAQPGLHGAFKRVVTIVLENEDEGNALANSYLASLSKKGAYFSNFRALYHPSYPNYLAMVAGTLPPGLNHSSPDAQVTVKVPTVADRLEAAHLSWKAYVENYPGDPDHPFLGDGSGNLYRRKHAPLLSFPSITDSRQRREHIVSVDPSRPDNAFATDVRSGNLPEYAFYSPNMKNDGHDTSLDYAARWLQHFLDSTKFPEGTLVVVTFDESAGSRDNRIYTVFLGDMVAKGTRVAQAYNHYSVLRTIEDNFGLAPLAGGDGSARAITGAWSPEVVARAAASQDAPASSVAALVASEINRPVAR